MLCTRDKYYDFSAWKNANYKDFDAGRNLYCVGDPVYGNPFSIGFVQMLFERFANCYNHNELGIPHNDFASLRLVCKKWAEVSLSCGAYWLGLLKLKIPK